ncbi:MMPL family transporter [Streptomyces sp. LRE541]|uniref:MMPL family transporter n=1 Tax=Streptomyces sp. LRE541 TaxID=2931983 RepID=UPI00200E1948|nr:MMPL family transporter [Streptomyces sp. LRE541]UPZ26971.1 MMPL family transporter [Streptomyces sp. LRE541]
MAALLYRLGALGARRWRTTLVGWLLALGAVTGLGFSFAGSFEDSGSIPGSPAQTALTKMDRHFPSPDVQSADIVFQAPPGRKVTDPDLRESLAAGIAAMGDVHGVAEVGDPVEDDTVSEDGRTAVAQVAFTTRKDEDVPAGTLDAVKDAGERARQAGLRTVYGGDAYAPSTSPFGPPEMVGLGVALVILVITFGSLLAAGLPLITAVLGVVGTMAAMMGAATVLGVSDSAPTLAMMLGLAVGIDYALFIVSRHRAQLAGGMPVVESVARANATAGSAVVFAGATVVIALAGLSVAGVPMLTSMGLASAGAVAAAVVLALGLLPALLGMAGHRLIPRAGTRRTRRPVRQGGTSMGVRWTEGVLRRPVRTLVLGAVALIALALPATQLKLALTDEGNSPTTTSSRQAYDLVGDAFGAGANGPLVILVEDDDPAAVASTATAVKDRLRDVEGIADVSGVEVAEDESAARIRIIPDTGPRTQETSDLVSRLRTEMKPLAESGGSYVAVTGLTAVSIDVSDKLSGALVPFAVVVVGLSLLLLMIAFRSVAVPVKADRGPGEDDVRPAALVLTIDSSVGDGTVGALVKRQLVLVGTALLLLLGLAVLVLRLGLRPLARMACTADAIAEGHLTERLPATRNGSEADRLAEAVNRAFDAQARAEATVRSLAADTSHELRTPLSTISGWLDLHRQGGVSGPGLETALEHIENEVGRMRLLVEDLALLARLDAGRPVERHDVDLTALAASVVEDAQIIYPRRAITLAPAPRAPVVGEADRLQQVLRNLVGNAVQHTPDRTAVRVEISQDREDVQLSVIDDGPGIAAQDLPRVFERFWRAEASRSRAYGGSGLGLAIVEAIVHAHQGGVRVESEVGVGTTVTIRLPRVPRGATG